MYPWFWVAWLFFGPLLNSVCRQWYIYINTRTLVRTEGLITQLVFEHSLRIRMKAGGSHDDIKDNTDTVIGTPETRSLDGNSSNVEIINAAKATSSHEATYAASTPVLGEDPKITKHTTKVDLSKQPTVTDSKKGDNLIGKINNLVTTDLNNLVDGRDFLIFGISFPSRCFPSLLICSKVLQVPLQIICCIVFLYQVLSWR